MLATLAGLSACPVQAADTSNVASGSPVAGSEAKPSAASILQQLRSFQNMGTVLYVAAHPDDENTQMIAYLARGKNYRTAYLSLTRGDGGQNLLAADLDERLGVARTQELLVARKLDGGRQFFTRAIDFGFSKDYQETLRIWNKDEVLADMVRIIRYFQPDVIITRFSPEPGGTHGHHTASAVLAREAFKLAGDPNAYPDQLKSLKPWQVKRVFMNRWGGGTAGFRMEIGGNDPVSGTSLNELAVRSRAMHKTQGFDNIRGGGGSGPRSEALNLLEGEPASNDIMEGVDTTWSRLPGGDDVARLVAEAVDKFDSANLPANLPTLLKIRAALSDVPESPVVREKRTLLDRVIADCAGLNVVTHMASAEFVPGETVAMQHLASVDSQVPVRWISSRIPGRDLVREPRELNAGARVEQKSSVQIPKDAPLTHPYWLRLDRADGMFRVGDLSIVTEPDNPPTYPIEHVFEVSGERIVLSDEPVVPGGDVDGGDRPLQVIPPVALSFNSGVAVFAPGSSRDVSVEAIAARAGVAGTVRLELPGDWKVSPAQRDFRLAKPGEKQRLTFRITAPRELTSAKIVASATVGDSTFRHERVEVRYRHLPLQLLHPLAAVHAVIIDARISASKVGYVPGAGDDIPAALQQLGCEVKILDGALTTNDLKGLDAVIFGVRAFNVRNELASQMPILTQFVESGGTVVVQYNTAGAALPAPFDLRLSRSRVTDESAEIRILAPDHAVLKSPNVIRTEDFSGWVQERGLYFPNQWSDTFTPILACNDPGENSLEGGLLVARHGKGHVVYTGLSFFRQLPAGVPGAYRLFANLVSLGK